MKDKLLSLLSNDFISGERLARNLGVSRTAVWKQISSLKKSGYEIESIKNKGYRLISRPDTPFSEEVISGLSTDVVGREVHYFDKISSTNYFAKQLANKGAQDGTMVVADVQTKGRGRKDRAWSSPFGGLWFSVILYPRIPPERGMLVTMTVSVAVAQAIEEITGLRPVIKWPNDLLLKGKKVCGILTELDAEMDKINYMVVGIGINVNNEMDKELRDMAISLKQIVGQVPRVKLLRSVIKYLDNNYSKLNSGYFDLR
jgi:BirA family biotin operon repressor/biotin-[acetyl-CoA-carboxylase] ligase